MSASQHKVYVNLKSALKENYDDKEYVPMNYVTSSGKLD